MGRVSEVISGDPTDRAARTIERDEVRLFEAPPAPMMRMLGAELAPLTIYSIPVTYREVPFSRPEGVFEGASMRLEWQTMTGRQPFYHRNADVDEISYHICGERWLMTECGTVSFAPGQLARIPLGVAHDNYGKADIHLIIYLHGPAVSAIEPVDHGRHAVPPFPGWEARAMVETITNAMGGPGGSVAYSMIDETLLLDSAAECADPLELIEPQGPAGAIEWLYRAPKVWIGHTRLEPAMTRHYRRWLHADEIQFQASGSRTIVSQRGVATLEPGDFVCIPRGCAYASVAATPSKHLSFLTTEMVPPAMTPSRFADADVAAWLAAHDAAVGSVH